MTGLDIVASALREIGVLGIGDAPGDVADLGIATLRRIFNSWNAVHGMAYVQAFTTRVLTSALQPHTIGPTGATFTVDQRPESIDSATYIDADGNRTPLEVTHDPAVWRDMSNQAQTGDIPTLLYYAKTYPNGSFYFWPVPAAAASVEIESRVLLSSLALADTFSLPPGYQEAAELTLAEELVTPCLVPMPDRLPQRASKARATLQANNRITPSITTRDAGMPGGGGDCYDFRNRTL